MGSVVHFPVGKLSYNFNEDKGSDTVADGRTPAARVSTLKGTRDTMAAQPSFFDEFGAVEVPF